LANTLTNLIPTIYEAIDQVSQEPVGLIPAVTLDASADRVAKDETITVPISPAAVSESIVPASTPPDTGDQEFANVTMAITKSEAVPFRWTGEEVKGIGNGPGFRNLRTDQIAQAIRTLRNMIEADLAATYTTFSRAFGTAGTTPFGSSLADTAQVRKILQDNGAPINEGISLVSDTSAGANLRSLANVIQANQAGTDATLRRGVLLDIHGMAIRESGQIDTHTKGTGTGYLHDPPAGATQPVGTTALHVDTGVNTIVPGDVVTFTGDLNKYIVASGFVGDGDGDIVLAAPGLRQTLANDVAMTIGANYAANMAFHRSAIILLQRAPAMPEEGDQATDVLQIPDPVTGLLFEFAVYPGYRRVRYEVAMAWGVKNIKPAHTALLLG
jgi:hypothetical protein